MERSRNLNTLNYSHPLAMEQHTVEPHAEIIPAVTRGQGSSPTTPLPLTLPHLSSNAATVSPIAPVTHLLHRSEEDSSEEPAILSENVNHVPQSLSAFILEGINIKRCP